MVERHRFERRLGSAIAAGRTSFLSAGASAEDWTGIYRMTSLEAQGRPGTWRAMLTGMA